MPGGFAFCFEGSKPTVAGIRNTSLIIQEFEQGENTAFYQP
jgi:hypothetical protein